MASTMKAWQYTSLKGALENSILLSNVTAPSKSSLSKDQILVKVITAAINPADYKLPESFLARFLVKAPAIPSLDFCGRVLEAPGSNTFKPGQLVFGAFSLIVQQGTLGEIIAISSSEVAPLPSRVNVDDAAAVGTSGSTAYLALLPEIVKPGVKVSINGGGVGTVKNLFLCSHPRGTFSDSSGAVLFFNLPLPHIIYCDYKKVDLLSELEKRGPVFDNVGSAGFYEQGHKYLQPNGAFVQVGIQTNLGSMGNLLKRVILPRILGGGSRLFTFVWVKSTTEDLTQIGEWMAEGKARSVIDSVFEIEDVPKAFEKLRTGRAKGKIVIHVGKQYSSAQV
jgi:NADPH:quinone reductase-like Zn-dependent oxidoreductase